MPFLTTMHGRLDLPGLGNVIREFPRAPFVSISDDQRRPLPEANWTATIHHGLPLDLFRSSYEQGGYLAFLGRLAAEKGPEEAIRIAHAVRRPLRIAAKIPRGETGYFKKRLEPLIDGKKVHLVGEVDDAKKQPFLAQAAALLFPIDWPEPFGLVMIEAMACGTPVIAYRSGSVPEVIEDGVTGFIVEDERQAIAAVHRLRNAFRRDEWRRSTKVCTENWLPLRLRQQAPVWIFSRWERERTKEDGSRKSVAVSHTSAGHLGGGRSSAYAGRPSMDGI